MALKGKRGGRQTPGYPVQSRAVPDTMDSIFRVLISALMNMELDMDSPLCYLR